MEHFPSGSTSRRRMVIIGAAVLAVLFFAVSILLFRRSADPYGGRILNNVIVGDVCVGGMTKKEAKAALQDMKADFETQDMVLRLPTSEYRMSPANTGVRLDVKATVNAAFAYGRSGTKDENHEIYLASEKTPHWITLTDCLNLDESKLQALVDNAAQACLDLYEEPSYRMEGQMPDLTDETLDENTAVPTLILHTGSGSYVLDTADTMEKILWAYNCHSFTVDIPYMKRQDTPEPMDLKALGAKINIDPTNFSMDKKTLEVIPGAFGCGFNVTAARRAMMKAGENEEVRIPMKLIAPEVGRQEAPFQDILGFCETPHGDTVNRNINMTLACEKINGLILQPGDTLSYNELLGQRTEAAGYKPAPAYSGTNLINTPGGGICQVSSTLYLASMYAELTALERVSHGFKPHYMQPGTDATVSWPYPDLKLQNNLDFPVKIKAEVTQDKTRVWILGTELRDYDVKVEVSVGSYAPTYIRSYLCKYDKETGEQISREFLSTSSYLD